MTREEVLAFIRGRAAQYRADARTIGAEGRAEMRAWANAADRVAADLERKWAPQAEDERRYRGHSGEML
jgi:hypothetical protein